MTEVGLFGAAYDLLPLADKLAMKRAYVNAQKTGLLRPDDPLDPYDALVPHLLSGSRRGALRPLGKVPIASAYCTKPSSDDRCGLSLPAWQEYLVRGGAAENVKRVRTFTREAVFPRIPVMLGVDHALTAGVVQALSDDGQQGPLGLLVFDGHLDAISAAARRSAYLGVNHAGVSVSGAPLKTMESQRPSPVPLPARERVRVRAARWLPSGTPAGGIPTPVSSVPAERYGCQNFLLDLIRDQTIRPEHLIVAGVYRKPDARLRRETGVGANAYLDELERLCDAGVQVLERDELVADPSTLERALSRLDVGRIYVSLDLDVCASERVPAVRFHDSVGMAPELLFDLTDRVNRFRSARGMALAGMDVMEMDVHLLGGEPDAGETDETLATACGFLETLF